MKAVYWLYGVGKTYEEVSPLCDVQPASCINLMYHFYLQLCASISSSDILSTPPFIDVTVPWSLTVEGFARTLTLEEQHTKRESLQCVLPFLGKAVVLVFVAFVIVMHSQELQELQEVLLVCKQTTNKHAIGFQLF